MNLLLGDYSIVPEIMDQNYLSHYGVLGMKWGVRRYQNENGSLTPAGVKRYNKQRAKDVQKNWSKAYNKTASAHTRSVVPQLNKKYEQYDFTKRHTDKKTANAYKKYVNEFVDSFNSMYVSELTSVIGERRDGGTDYLPFYMNADDYDD